MSELLNEIMKFNETSLQEILNSLINYDDNLDLKTHILQPKNLASFYILGVYLEMKGYEQSAEVIKIFLDKFSRNMVSYKRLSRTEIIKAISSNLEQKQEIKGSKKLTTNLK